VPRQAIIGFLESGEGLAFAIVVYTAIALVAFIAFFAWLRRAERSSTPVSMEIEGRRR